MPREFSAANVCSWSLGSGWKLNPLTVNRQPGEIEAGDAALARKIDDFCWCRRARIEVHLDPWANLVLHTASLYELFDGQGRDDALCDDAAARAAVRPDLLAAFGGKERCYSRHGTVNVVAPAMLAVAKRAGVDWPSAAALEALAPEPFGRALASTWESFYA